MFVKLYKSRSAHFAAAGLACLVLGGCAASGVVGRTPTGLDSNAKLTPAAPSHGDLTHLPPPRGKISVAVYGFRDQTGQYKPAPDSTFSTAVTQGAGSMLVKALLDSQWFLPVEREGLQNLLTERKIVRAAETQNNPAPAAPAAGAPAPVPAEAPAPERILPPLQTASILLDGGVVAYEQNVQTGGAGARYFGIGANEQYRVDQVTVNLRATDVRTGQVLNSVLTTKTVLSRELDAGVFHFVSFRRLFEAEAGYTRNEPAQLAVLDAIEAAVAHLIISGAEKKHWAFADPAAANLPIVQQFLQEQHRQIVAKPD